MQTAKMSGLAEGSHGETKQSGFTTYGESLPCLKTLHDGTAIAPKET